LGQEKKEHKKRDRRAGVKTEKKKACSIKEPRGLKHEREENQGGDPKTKNCIQPKKDSYVGRDRKKPGAGWKRFCEPPTVQQKKKTDEEKN